MQARVKYGLIVGVIGLVVNVCVSTVLGICGPVIALLAGAAAGFFAGREEKASPRSEGAKIGAISGAIAGGLTLAGQIAGGLLALVWVQSSLGQGVLGEVSGTLGGNLAYWGGGLGTSLCFGVVGVVLSALAGAGVGYLATPESPVPPDQPTQA